MLNYTDKIAKNIIVKSLPQQHNKNLINKCVIFNYLTSIKKHNIFQAKYVYNTITDKKQSTK